MAGTSNNDMAKIASTLKILEIVEDTPVPATPIGDPEHSIATHTTIAPKAMIFEEYFNEYNHGEEKMLGGISSSPEQSIVTYSMCVGSLISEVVQKAFYSASPEVRAMINEESFTDNNRGSEVTIFQIMDYARLEPLPFVFECYPVKEILPRFAIRKLEIRTM